MQTGVPRINIDTQSRGDIISSIDIWSRALYRLELPLIYEMWIYIEMAFIICIEVHEMIIENTIMIMHRSTW